MRRFLESVADLYLHNTRYGVSDAITSSESTTDHPYLLVGTGYRQGNSACPQEELSGRTVLHMQSNDYSGRGAVNVLASVPVDSSMT